MTTKSELFPKALNQLRELGFAFGVLPWNQCFGRNVRAICRSGDSEIALIQTRSHQKTSWRYLVGLMIDDLMKVDSVILWFEGESLTLRIPGLVLREWLVQMRSSNDARYSGNHNQQWRINVDLKKLRITPQGFRGSDWLPLEQYVLEGRAT